MVKNFYFNTLLFVEIKLKERKVKIMSLLDIYKKVESDVEAKEQAKKDLKEHKDSEYFELPDGKFGSTLLDVAHGAKAGRPWTTFKFSIDYPQEYAGKKYSIFITLNETTSKGNPMPQAVLEKSMRYCLEIAALLGIKVPATDFAGDADANGLALAKTFEPAFNEGKLEVVKKSKPNPRNANFSYTDYYFNPFNRGLVQANAELEQKQAVISEDKQEINRQVLQSQAEQQQQAKQNGAADYWQHTQSQAVEVPFPEEPVGQQPTQPAQQQPLTAQQKAWGQIGNPGYSRGVRPAQLPSDTNNPNEITITKDDIPF